MTFELNKATPLVVKLEDVKAPRTPKLPEIVPPVFKIAFDRLLDDQYAALETGVMLDNVFDDHAVEAMTFDRLFDDQYAALETGVMLDNVLDDHAVEAMTFDRLLDDQ